VPPLDPVVPPNPNQGVGARDTMIGVRLVKLDPRNPRIVYATAWNNAIHRSAPSLEGGDASFKPVFAVIGLQRFGDLRWAISRLGPHGSAHNGTQAPATQGAARLDNADAGVWLRPGRRQSRTPAPGSDSSHRPARPGSTSRNVEAVLLRSGRRGAAGTAGQ
jgi:hypothetical protein